MRHVILVLAVMVTGIIVWSGACSRFDPYPQYRHGEPMQESMWAVPEVHAYTSRQTHQDRRDILRLWRLKRRVDRRSYHHSGHGGGCFIGTIE